MDTIKDLLSRTKNRKLVIFDNFYQITPEFAEYTTFSRKYNASTVYIAHSFFSSKVGSRMREFSNYVVLFYLIDSKTQRRSLKSVIGEDMMEVFYNKIGYKSYKSMLIVPYDNTYYINPPDVKPEILFKKDEK